LNQRYGLFADSKNNSTRPFDPFAVALIDAEAVTDGHEENGFM
jgi:hypothetical protein